MELALLAAFALGELIVTGAVVLGALVASPFVDKPPKECLLIEPPAYEVVVIPCEPTTPAQ